MKMHPRFHSSPKYSQGSSGSYAADRSYIDDGKHNVSEEPLQMSDLESETILKQRKELQLLIGELKDRDKELNEMVAAHQQQLSAWERDRRRVVELEHRNERLEVEIRKRNEQLRLLIQRLKISDSRQKTKDSIIDTTKQKLAEAQHEIESTSAEKRDLENMNDALNTSLSDISSKIGRLEAKEQEFFTQLQLKDGDLVEAESEIREMKSKLRRVEVELHECRKSAAAAHVDLEQQKARYKQSRTELDRTIAEMATKTGDLISARQELTMLREEVQNLKRDLYASEEQIRRKEEFIELQKSKQERTNVELAALRQLYERQQQELSVLQSNLETSQEMLSKQEDRLNDLSSGNVQRGNVESKPSVQNQSEISSETISDGKSEAVDCLEQIKEEIKQLKHNIENSLSFTQIPRAEVVTSSSDSEQDESVQKCTSVEKVKSAVQKSTSVEKVKSAVRLSCSERLALILKAEYDQDSVQFRKIDSRIKQKVLQSSKNGHKNEITLLYRCDSNISTVAVTEMTETDISSCPLENTTEIELAPSVSGNTGQGKIEKESETPFPSGMKIQKKANKKMIKFLSHHALDLDAVECSSQTTNDLLEEAQRSSEVDPLSMFNQHKRSPRPQNGMESSGSSPTSKLQRLLSESREMVHNLERTALSPSPRSSYRSRSTERRY